MKHSLFSQNKDAVVAWFDRFDKEKVKQAIITHLNSNPTDTIEHCKEYAKNDLRRFYGQEIISFYKMQNGKVCKVVLRGNKEHLKPIT